MSGEKRKEDENPKRDSRNILKYKEEIKRKYQVKEIGIFGSYVKGKQREASDLDILVEFESGAKIGLLKLINLENYLSDLLGIKVDLVIKSALRPKIEKQILKEAIYL